MKAKQSGVFGFSFRHVALGAAMLTSLAAAGCADVEEPSSDALEGIVAPVANDLQPRAALAVTLGDAAEAEASMEGAAETSGARQIPMPSYGYLNAHVQGGHACSFTVDGVPKGISSSLQLTLLSGNHHVACTRSDGAVASQSFTVTKNATSYVSLILPGAGPGSLVAVAIGGYCSFTVNGAPKGTSSQLKLTLPPGIYAVGCTSGSGVKQTKSVKLVSGEMSMVTFNAQ